MKPLTIAQLRQAADHNRLTPQDLQQISWLRTARKIMLPHGPVEKVCMEMGQFVRAYRENNKLTAKEFGARCGMSASAVSQIELGFRRSLSLKTLQRLMTACGMELVLTTRKPKHPITIN